MFPFLKRIKPQFSYVHTQTAKRDGRHGRTESVALAIPNEIGHVRVHLTKFFPETYVIHVSKLKFEKPLFKSVIKVH